MQPREASEPAGRPQTPALQGLRLRLPPSQVGPRAAAAAGLISGFLLFLAFPPAEIWPLAFVALVPVAWVFRGSEGPSVTMAAAGLGLSFFGCLLYWISLFGPEAYAALVILMMLWTIAGLRIAAAARRRGRRVLGVLVFAAAIVAGEWFRAKWPFGGFAWGELGNSQSNNPLLLPLAAYTGVWGLSFVVAFCSAAVTEALADIGRPVRAMAWIAVALALVVAPALLPTADPIGPEIGVALIQGNAPEDLEDPHADDVEVLENHVRLTLGLREAVDLVVWPESSIDVDPLENPPFRRAVEGTARSLSTPIATGAVLSGPGPDRFRNATVLWGPDGGIEEIYVKRHLVPFGEYVPGRALVESVFGSFVEELQEVPGDAVPGDEVKLFEIGEGKVASVICFESTFTGPVRSSVREGAGVLVVSTNNSSFERTAASRQHVAFSKIRAAEHRMWVLHVALTGISAVVAPNGRVLEETGLFEEAVLIPRVRFQEEISFYARAGDWLPLISLAFLGVLVAGRLLGRRRVPVAPPAPLGDPPDGKPLILIPTFNEVDSIAEVIRRTLEHVPDGQVLVIDDSSPDGTAAVVEELAAVDPRIHLLVRDRKQGLGRAYASGFAWGMERGEFGRFVEMDADLSHDPGALPSLLDASRDADLVVGTRYMEGGGVRGWSPTRHVLSRAGNLYARLLLGFPLRDSTSGFRVYTRRGLGSVDLTRVHSEGYAFQIDMAYRVWSSGLRIAEVPIIFRERKSGESKMSRRIVREALWAITGWGIRDVIFGASPPDATAGGMRPG